MLCMARDNNVVLSDSELESLQDVREAMYGSHEVPYGVVIQALIDNYNEYNGTVVGDGDSE